MLDKLSSLLNRQSTCSNEQINWYRDTIEQLKVFKPERLAGRDFNKSAAEIEQYVETLRVVATHLGEDADYGVKMLINQFFYASLFMQQTDYSDAFKVAQIAGYTREYTNKLLEAALTQKDNILRLRDKSLSPTWGKPQSPKTVDSTSAARRADTATPNTEPIRPENSKENAALLLAEGFRICKNQNISVADINGGLGFWHSLRHDVYRFKKPPSVSFGSLSSGLEDVLSHAGYPPRLPVIFDPLPNNEFELQIPRPPSEWATSNILTNILNFYNTVQNHRPIILSRECEEYLDKVSREGLRHVRPSESVYKELELLILSFTTFIHSNTKLNANPRVPFGVDLYGRIIRVSLVAGCFIVGDSNSGKSTAQKTLVNMFRFFYSPKHLRLWFFDAESSAFAQFRKTAWTEGYISNFKTTPEEDIEGTFERLQRIQQERERKLADLGLESWMEYNGRFPENPMPFHLILLDGVSAAKQDWKPERIDYWLSTIALRWRKQGIVVCPSANYASKERSVDPSSRSSLQTTIAFQCSEDCAAMAFGDTSAKKLVRTLTVGDFIIRDAHDNSQFKRGQCFDSPPALVEVINRALDQRFPTDYNDCPEGSESVSSFFASMPFKTSVGNENIPDMKARFDRLIHMEQANAMALSKGSPEVYSLGHAYAELTGDRFFTDGRKGKYAGPINSLDELSPDDPRRKAAKGGNRNTSRQQLERIISLFEGQTRNLNLSGEET